MLRIELWKGWVGLENIVTFRAIEVSVPKNFGEIK